LEPLGWLDGRLPGFWLGWPQLPGFWLGWLPLPGFWIGWPQLPGLLEPLGWSLLCDVSVDWLGLSAGDADGRLPAAGACGPETHVTTDEAPTAASAAPAVIKSATTASVAPA
jgi:hypothetical protein